MNNWFDRRLKAMKGRLANLIILLLVLFLSSSFNVPYPSSNCPEGIYQTYEDFLSKKLTDAGKFMYVSSTYRTKIIFKKDDKETSYELRKAGFWGVKIRCEDCRIFNGGLYKIFASGNVFLYGYGDAHVYFDNEGNPKSFAVNTEKGGIRISKGGNGELINCSQKNLESMFSDDEDIISNARGIKLKGVHLDSKYDEYIENVYSLIVEYNKRHK